MKITPQQLLALLQKHSEEGTGYIRADSTMHCTTIDTSLDLVALTEDINQIMEKQ